MTLTELKYIIAVAQELHFGRAANKCCVSQPTLSVAVSKLENSLGVILFERSHAEIRITEVGQQIINQAQIVLENANAIQEIAKSSRCQLQAPLKIGGIYTVAPYLFPLLLPTIHQLSPDMPFIIQEGFTGILRKKLQNGELDVIVVALPFEEKSIVVKSVYDEPLVVLMPKAHPLARTKAITSQMLADETLLLPGKGHCLRDQITTLFPNFNFENSLQYSIEGASLETLRHMVASGLGMTILPLTAAKSSSYSDVLCTVPFQSSHASRTIAMAWRATFTRPKVIDVLIKAFEQIR